MCNGSHLVKYSVLYVVDHTLQYAEAFSQKSLKSVFFSRWNGGDMS